MADNNELYIKHKEELSKFEQVYYDMRNAAYAETDLDRRIELLTKVVDQSKRFESFCKDVGLSKYVNEMYKQAVTRKGKTNLFKEDRDELKRCMLLKKVLKKVEKLSFTELQSVDEHIKLLKQPESSNSTNQQSDQKRTSSFNFFKWFK